MLLLVWGVTGSAFEGCQDEDGRYLADVAIPRVRPADVQRQLLEVRVDDDRQVDL